MRLSLRHVQPFRCPDGRAQRGAAAHPGRWAGHALAAAPRSPADHGHVAQGPACAGVLPPGGADGPARLWRFVSPRGRCPAHQPQQARDGAGRAGGHESPRF